MIIEVTLKMTREDAQRFMQSFKDGKLADLGVVDVLRASPVAPDNSNRQWANSEQDRRDSSSRIDTPILE